jgi:aminopeptidase YwaD
LSGRRVHLARLPGAARRLLALLLVAAGAAGVPGPAAAAPAGAPPEAHEVAAALARLGPRPAGEEAAQEPAVELLLQAMRRAGLQEVQAVAAAGEPELKNLTGVLPGESGQEVVLSAHYDTVPGSAGAGDDASGCGVAVAAAAELARTPRRHAIRVVLFDGEEAGLRGSRAWVGALDEEALARTLAVINVEMVGWAGSRGPVIHALPVRDEAGRRALPPGWLVHAVLETADRVGWGADVSDNRFPVLSQLVQRSARVRFAADADPFLRRGGPAVTLSDSSFLALDPAYHRPADAAERLDAARLERWTDLVAATARRLDTLAGRPRPEDRWLAAFGRVWIHRDLLWAGFVLWALLVFRGAPGRWRGGTRQQRRAQHRRYLPGFAFRVLMLLAILLAPVFAVLLFPAALLALAPPRRLRWRAAWLALGSLPLLVFLASLAAAAAFGIASWRGLFSGAPPTALLVPAALAAWAVTIALAGPRVGPAEEAFEPAEAEASP